MQKNFLFQINSTAHICVSRQFQISLINLENPQNSQSPQNQSSIDINRQKARHQLSLLLSSSYFSSVSLILFWGKPVLYLIKNPTASNNSVLIFAAELSNWAKGFQNYIFTFSHSKWIKWKNWFRSQENCWIKNHVKQSLKILICLLTVTENSEKLVEMCAFLLNRTVYWLSLVKSRKLFFPMSRKLLTHFIYNYTVGKNSRQNYICGLLCM